jgi:hypothetical protein
MSRYSQLLTGAASIAGGIAGKVVIPPFVAPAARYAAQATMTYMWGASKGFMDSMIRNGIAEHVGYQAFKCAVPVAGVVGSAATLAAIKGTTTLVSYGKHVRNNNAFLNGVKKYESTESVGEEVKEFEGFQMI